ncbi:uncharacterized protein (TIGR03083 family) [Halopolyspora algeriensis]|uniref:Uncharacterized protein (TIGR03083 family) n=1 Tax=Halopolyspora algeriensis TaxID=1500506 RepID=A0A368VZX3_9ACTN|nr:maleylpyruvate isomerase family mycothiol-dependent enzyme [Halopolyspora algeriensis]RCW46922.1 uncharacterized protein (TIGR03083 family) [Halopolyspora algeriensis]TQM48013.1 uncharacterized protein (TIGR03083 family) [Halopolyspora algeriensis]
MMSDSHHHELTEQAAAFRERAVLAGPDATVSNCPGWDMRKMVRHLARVYAMANLAVDTEPESPTPRAPAAPEDFTEALAWWDDQLAELTDKLRTGESDRSVWSFFPGGTPSSWARRMAHETAIHRLDAEQALADSGVGQVHELLFDPVFAADGVDEMLSVLLSGTRRWEEQHGDGQVLFHAADAERTWMVTFRSEQPPETGALHDAALGRPDVDATVAGTADAIYRRVWGRPSTAVVSGDSVLAGLISGR